MDQLPKRGSRIDGNALMPLIAGAAAGVAVYTIGSGLLIAAVTTALVCGLAYATLALRNHFRKNR